MPARHEQIGERAVHEQAMSVLRQSAIAHLDKAKHSLNDPDRMLDPGSHFRFGAVFRPLDLIDNTAVAIAAIGEIAGFGRSCLSLIFLMFRAASAITDVVRVKTSLHLLRD